MKLKEKRERLIVASFTVRRAAWSQFQRLIIELTMKGRLNPKTTSSSLIREFIDSFNIRYSDKYKKARILKRKEADLEEELKALKGE